MTIEQQIYDLIYAGAAQILTTNEYATGKNYETDIGQYLQEWLGKINPEDTTEAFEIRDSEGDGEDFQEPVQHEILNIEFVIGVKKGSSTSSYLRSAKADIYRMIGKNLSTWRAAVNGSLKIDRNVWSKQIDHSKQIYGELNLSISIQYIGSEWLLEE